MEVEQARWTTSKEWEPCKPGRLSESAQLVLFFGSTNILKDKKYIDKIKNMYPNAFLCGCSTAGEIFNIQVSEESVVITAVKFEYTKLKRAYIKINKREDSFYAGKHLAQSLSKKGLRHVLVLSDGLIINGSELVRGLIKYLPKKVSVTGGLSGDGNRFKETLVFDKEYPDNGVISVLGLYGDRLKIGYGCKSGWDPFGPERLITKSKGSVLYEMDGKPVLELYKKYLGTHADGLPATGLYFPLNVRIRDRESAVVRAILSVNEEEQSIAFAGDVPEGAHARLMIANFDRLIEGAIEAAKTNFKAIGSLTPNLAILISCNGRKMVLKQRIEEELEAVSAILGNQTILTGFYSYGEISASAPNSQCELQNQTMTITTLLEI